MARGDAVPWPDEPAGPVARLISCSLQALYARVLPNLDVSFMESGD